MTVTDGTRRQIRHEDPGTGRYERAGSGVPGDGPGQRRGQCADGYRMVRRRPSQAMMGIATNGNSVSE